MKEGLTLNEMAAEITRQNSMKEDYLVDTRSLQMEPYDSQIYLHMFDGNTEPVEPMQVNTIAHRQFGTHLKIPAPYYDRMLTEKPELLAANVNAWLQHSPSKRLLRTMGGTARAFLSNRYRRIDNMEIAQAVLPIIGQMEGARFESCQITDSRMYMKVVNTRLEAEVVPGDIVQAGVIISNSETGMGAVNIQPLVYRLVCSNGMIVNDAQTRRNHVGRVNDMEENFQLYSEKTLAADDKAFILKIQDTVRAAVEEARFAQVVGLMQNATQAEMNTKDVPGIVKLASREFHITDDEGEGILQHLIEGKDLTLYGLSNAVTRHSQDVENYDRATQLESIGYNILSMPEGEFTQEELAEDIDGLQMSFPRIKIPAGGTLQFEIPSDDPENPDYAKTLEGVILFNHPNNAYWPEGSEYDDSATPLCSSVDGKQGIGEPGGSCAACALNQFGSAAEGKGKACKNMRVLYLLRSGEFMPLQVTLPPTSLKPFRDFMNQSFMLRRRATYGSVVQIGLKKMNNGKDDYSVATFRRLYDFSGEELAQIRKFADGFKEQIRMMLQQRTTINETQHDDGCDYGKSNVEVLPAGGSGKFNYGQPLDGEREALPA